MFRIVVYLCVFMCCSFSAWSEVNEQAQKDALTSSAATDLKAKLAMLTSFKASFSQTVVDIQGELVQQSEGELLLKQPNLMVWRVDSPEENLLVADGQTLWYVDPFVEQVTAKLQAQSIANNPVILLTDPNNQSWEDFEVKYHQDHYVILAKSPESQISQLKLYFKNQQLLKLVFVDRQQQSSELLFSNTKQNFPLDNTPFVFTVPDGYELDDQR